MRFFRKLFRNNTRSLISPGSEDLKDDGETLSPSP